MTYSQMWNHSGNEAEIHDLKEQIKIMKDEIKRTEAAQLRDTLDQAKLRLAELEAKLDELEDL